MVLVKGVVFLIKTKQILDEKDKRLRQISKEVTFPLDQKYIDFINDSIEMLTLSQIDEEAKKFKTRYGIIRYSGWYK